MIARISNCHRSHRQSPGKCSSSFAQAVGGPPFSYYYTPFTSSIILNNGKFIPASSCAQVLSVYGKGRSGRAPSRRSSRKAGFPTIFRSNFEELRQAAEAPAVSLSLSEAPTRFWCLCSHTVPAGAPDLRKKAACAEHFFYSAFKNANPSGWHIHRRYGR